MNIQTVIDWLNKEYGYNLSSDYYRYIAIWRNWWEGIYKPFHQYKEHTYDGKLLDRKLYTLKMAKKVCEDWASILLNEKTEIVISDEKSSAYIHGIHEADTGINGPTDVEGVFDNNDFWTKANELMEKTFYSGTGAFVLRFENMELKGKQIQKSGNTEIRIEYLPASQIIPLSVKRGHIVDVAFVSEVLLLGKKYIYLETHVREQSGYTIKNLYFEDTKGGIHAVPLPEGILESYSTGSDVPLFAIVKPNIVNNIDENTGLGISVYANAIDNLEGTDLAFNNFCRDSKLGGKKVFMNEQLTRQDENGNVLTPDDVAQQLFVSFADNTLSEDGTSTLIHEYNPMLRTQENRDNVQAQLDYLSFKCGLGTKHYQFNAGQIVTATQYMGDKQELIQNASKHYIMVAKALKDLVRAILWAGREICGANVDPDARVTVTFDDSYIIDKESERLRDQQEVREGIMQKWEYRAKWYGEDEKTAKAMIQTDEGSNDDWFGGEE